MMKVMRISVWVMLFLCTMGMAEAQDDPTLPEMKVKGETERERLLNFVPLTYEHLSLVKTTASILEMEMLTDEDLTEEQVEHLKQLAEGKVGVDHKSLILQISLPERKDDSAQDQQIEQQAANDPDEQDSEDEGGPIVNIYKLKDRQLYEKSYGMKDSRGGLKVGQGPLGDDVFYVRYVGDYVLSSTDELTMLTMEPAYHAADLQKSFEGSVIKNFEAYEFQFVFNWEVIKASINEDMKFQVNGRDLPVNEIPFLKQLVEKYKSFLNEDIQRIIIGVNPVDGVLEMDCAISFREGSEVGQWFSKKLPPLKVDRLPHLPFYAIMSFNSSFMPMQLGTDGFFTEVEKYYADQKKTGEETDPALKTQYDIWKMLYQISHGELNTSDGQILAATTKRPGISSVLTMINVIQTNDSKALIPAYEKTVPLLHTMMKEAGMGHVGLKVSKDVAKINGKSVSQLEFTKLPAQLEIFNLHRLYLSTTEKHSFEMWGGDFNLLNQALKAMDGQGTLEQDPKVKEMMNQTLENSFFTMCFSMGQVGTTMVAINKATKKVAPDFPELKPMFMSMAGQQGWLRIKAAFPMKSLREFSEATEEAEALQAAEEGGAM